MKHSIRPIRAVVLLSAAVLLGACEPAGGESDTAEPPPTSCEEQPEFAPCDDGDPCTFSDLCITGGCVGTEVVCAGECHSGVCDPATGECEAARDGTACDDGDACTEESCVGGACVPTDETACPPGPCQTGTCDPATGACVAADDGAACVPTDPCHEAGSGECVAGECTFLPKLCVGPCLRGDCGPDGECVVSFDGAACDDGSGLCTEGVCTDGACVSQPLPCTGDCLTGECDPATGCVTVDDGTPCVNGAPCEEPGTGACEDGYCSYTPKACDGPCHEGGCHPVTGECFPVPDGTACDDGSACTDERCEGGACVPQDVPCTGDCLTGECDPATGCVTTVNGFPCDDGDTCTTGDACADGFCAGAPVVCDGPCDGACDAETGACAPVPDGTPCPGGGTCQGGACECPDGPCTVTLVPGVYTIAGLTSLEAPHLLQAQSSFANVTGAGPLVAFAGAEGTVIIDLLDGPVLYESLIAATDVFGVVGVTRSPSGAGSNAALFTFGAGDFVSGLRNYYPGTGTFGFSQLLPATYYDGVPIGGGAAEAPGLVVTSPTAGVALVLFDDSDPEFARFAIDDTATLPANDFPGALLSAYGHTPGGPVLAITDGAPGEVFVHDRGAGPAVLVGERGHGTGKVRCLPPLCVVSDFGGDGLSPGTLTILSWDGVGLTPTIRGATPVGAGPVGVDLIAVQGHILVVSTGFGDDTYTETALDPATGAVLDSVTTPVPEGCAAPAHAIYVPAASLSIVLTCFESGTYVIAVSSL